MGEPDGGGSSPRVSKGREGFLSARPYGGATAWEFSHGQAGKRASSAARERQFLRVAVPNDKVALLSPFLRNRRNQTQ